MWQECREEATYWDALFFPSALSVSPSAKNEAAHLTCRTIDKLHSTSSIVSFAQRKNDGVVTKILLHVVADLLIRV